MTHLPINQSPPLLFRAIKPVGGEGGDFAKPQGNEPPPGSEVLNCPRAHSSDITPRKKTVLGWLCSQRDVQACGGAGKNYAGLLGVKSWDERGKWTV